MCDFCFCCQYRIENGISASSLNRFKDDDNLNKKNTVPPVQKSYSEMATTLMGGNAGSVRIVGNPLAGIILLQSDARNVNGSNGGSLKGFLSGNCPARASTAQQNFTV